MSGNCELIFDCDVLVYLCLERFSLSLFVTYEFIFVCDLVVYFCLRLVSLAVFVTVLLIFVTC